MPLLWLHLGASGAQAYGLPGLPQAEAPRLMVDRAAEKASFYSRLPIDQRAGTRIDHRSTVKIFTTIDGRRELHGLLDQRQRFYQCGGDFADFTYWKLRIISLPKDVWEEIADYCRRIECIDHEDNRCYSIHPEVLASNLEEYDAGIGPRVGAAIGLWESIPGPARPPSGWQPIEPQQPPSTETDDPPQKRLFD
jgi:hypothetical protein